jgi:hypothetical protein
MLGRGDALLGRTVERREERRGRPRLGCVGGKGEVGRASWARLRSRRERKLKAGWVGLQVKKKRGKKKKEKWAGAN